MKVMRLSKGLGNTMFQYATYLQLKKMYPDEEIYVDTIWFDFTGYPCHIKQVFNLNLDDIDYHKIFEKRKKVSLKDDIEKLIYWSDYSTWLESERVPWHGHLSYEELPKLYLNYGESFEILSDQFQTIKEWEQIRDNKVTYKETTQLRKMAKKILGDTSNKSYLFFKTMINKYPREKYFSDLLHLRKPDYCGDAPIKRLKKEGNVYYNIHGTVNDCCGIREELLQSFSFSKIDDKKNMQTADLVEKTESVSIHARVTFFEYGMKQALQRDYYNKAVNHIKKNNKNKLLTFFVFSDDVEWCKKNYRVLGLQKTDQIIYVEGNKNDNSFRDMQLMSLCKHNIIPNSTFSWWAGYLNRNPNKIVITPFATLSGTISF